MWWPVGACWHEFVSAIAAVLHVKTNFLTVVCWSISKLHVLFFKIQNTTRAEPRFLIDLRPGSSSNITASSSSFLDFFSAADTQIRIQQQQRQVDSSQPHQPPRPRLSFLFLRDENKVLNSFLLYRQTKMLLAGWHPLKDERRERKWTFFLEFLI